MTDRRSLEQLVAEIRRVADAIGIAPHDLGRTRFRRFGSPLAHTQTERKLWGKAKAIASGAEDHSHIVAIPDGHHIVGVSTYVGKDGRTQCQWIKTRRGGADAAELIERISERVEDRITERSSSVLAPSVDDGEGRLAVYPMGDPHIGMYSAARETGGQWDRTRATRVFRGAIDRLSQRGLPARDGLLISLGDGIHADRQGTTTKGTPVDTDGRWWEALLDAVDLKIYMIDRLLEVHERVTVWIVAGNHDRHTAFSVALSLAKHYRQEPRVEIPINPSGYWYMRHGATLIGSTHGDTVSPSQTARLAMIMAADRPKDWAKSKDRVWLMGHVHHLTAKEEIGCRVETFRTLSRADAWHHREGYRSGRDMRRLVFDQYGETERTIVSGFALEKFE